jgi:hypothetical protein
MTRIADLPTHIVSTGITTTSGGPLYVGTLGQFPFSPDDGRVYKVGYPTGNLTQIASGVSSITDVELGPGGQLYAVSFGAQATDPNGPPWTPFSAQIMKVDAATGTFVPLVSGFSFATSLIFSGDTAYIVNDAVDVFGPGEIWQIPNFSSIQPIEATPTAAPAPSPTAVKPVGITPPNTGSGPDDGRGGGLLLLFALGAGALGVITLGGAAAARRR